MEKNYRWVIVAAGALMGCVAIGAMFSLAIFLEPISRDTGWSRAAISSAMSLNFITLGLGAFAWGWASDRYGARVVVTIGAVLLGLALVLASRTTSLVGFQVTYGVLVGLSASAFLAPMIATVMGWFTTQRALAVSLVSAGMGAAPMTVSPIAQWLVTDYGWRPAMLMIGIGAWLVTLPCTLLVRRPPAAEEPAEAGSPPSRGRQGERGSQGELWQALSSPQFIVLGLTFFACCAAHAGPIFHMVSYAMVCGIGPMAAVSIYSVEGLAGLGGRVLFGVAADKLGTKRVLIFGLLVQALAIGSYVHVRELKEFYSLAIVFGAAYGGVMPLYSVLARDYFRQEVMGSVLGAAMMVSSIGMAAGPLIGGWVYDHYNTYTWMFLGSAAVGLGAVAMAFAFPKPGRAAV
ncbi:MFS transporter [Usitatibacter rugosus]|nr:MFS transporter [Usitatibacter rugosus]